MYGKDLYGSIRYGLSELTIEDKEKFNPDLMRYLPSYYQRDKGTMYLLQQLAISPELGELKYAMDELLTQFFVDIATWGLELWERELNIQTDINKSYEQRREIIKAKLRGAGTTTKEMIRNVAEAFSGGEVIVEEEPEQARFVLRFIGTVGIPPNMAGLTKAIEDIKPAHLAYEYAYTWSWWGKPKELGLTWGQAKNKGLTWGTIKTYGLER